MQPAEDVEEAALMATMVIVRVLTGTAAVETTPLALPIPPTFQNRVVLTALLTVR